MKMPEWNAVQDHATREEMDPVYEAAVARALSGWPEGEESSLAPREVFREEEHFFSPERMPGQLEQKDRIRTQQKEPKTRPLVLRPAA